MNFSGVEENSFSQGSLPRINMGAYPDISSFRQQQLLIHRKLRLLLENYQGFSFLWAEICSNYIRITLFFQLTLSLDRVNLG